VSFLDGSGGDGGLRIVDLNADGSADILVANEDRFVVALWQKGEGWAAPLWDGPCHDGGTWCPMLATFGKSTGAWFVNGTMWIQNECNAFKQNASGFCTFDEILSLECHAEPCHRLLTSSKNDAAAESCMNRGLPARGSCAHAGVQTLPHSSTSILRRQRNGSKDDNDTTLMWVALAAAALAMPVFGGVLGFVASRMSKQRHQVGATNPTMTAQTLSVSSTTL